MDAALSCLAAPPHAALFPPFTDADIFARALHFSTMPDTTNSSSSAAASPSSSSSSAAFLADFAYGTTAGGAFALSAPPPSTIPAITCESVLVADTARPSPAAGRRHQLGPAAGGRAAGKRRSRASKRAPTTYISTDPANFRIMVQHVTGVQADPSLAAADNIIAHLPTATSPFDAAAASSHHLLDTTTTAASAFVTNPMLLQTEHYQQQQQQPCFPTLDSSWSAVMYDAAATDHLL